MLKDISTTELIIVAVIVLLLFGGSKLPELAKGLGEAFHQFKKAFGDVNGEKETKGKKK